MNPIDTLAQNVSALQAAVDGLRSENTALKAQVAAYEAQDAAISDAAGKVAVLTESISSPPAPVA